MSMTERDWEEIRRRARKRAAAQMSLIIGPVVLLVAAIKILEPHSFPPGDIRNEPAFWVVLGVVALVVSGAQLALSVRWLINDWRGGHRSRR